MNNLPAARSARPRVVRDLNAEGYLFVRVAGSLHSWVIVKPDGLTTYHVDLAANLCSCKAGELMKPTCCHRQEAWRRVMAAGAAFLGDSATVTKAEPAKAPVSPANFATAPNRPRPVIDSPHGFATREAFLKARSADFD